MRAERFGSYSIPITSAATPYLRRLKSTLRYLCLCPPPICRDVSRPRLLRPPLFFLGSRRLFSGRHFVTSSNAGSDLKRCVGVSGRNSFRAITSICHSERSEESLNSAPDNSTHVGIRRAHIRSIFSPSFKVTIAFFHRGRRPSGPRKRFSLPA